MYCSFQMTKLPCVNIIFDTYHKKQCSPDRNEKTKLNNNVSKRQFPRNCLYLLTFFLRIYILFFQLLCTFRMTEYGAHVSVNFVRYPNLIIEFYAMKSKLTKNVTTILSNFQTNQTCFVGITCIAFLENGALQCVICKVENEIVSHFQSGILCKAVYFKVISLNIYKHRNLALIFD